MGIGRVKAFYPKKCLFEQNYAKNVGGGIQFRNSSGQGVVKVEECEFKNNIARSSGAINIFGVPFQIKNCDFISNTASDINGTPIYPSFGLEIDVTINGLSFDAMEPFISADGNYLFFNNKNDGIDTKLFYATKINDSTFT